MFSNKDVLMIKNINSEYIDKIIVILNKECKNKIVEEDVICQAQRIVDEYSDKITALKFIKFKKMIYNIILFAMIFSALILLYISHKIAVS